MTLRTTFYGSQFNKQVASLSHVPFIITPHLACSQFNMQVTSLSQFAINLTADISSRYLQHLLACLALFL